MAQISLLRVNSHSLLCNEQYIHFLGEFFPSYSENLKKQTMCEKCSDFEYQK